MMPNEIAIKRLIVGLFASWGWDGMGDGRWAVPMGVVFAVGRVPSPHHSLV